MRTVLICRRVLVLILAISMFSSCKSLESEPRTGRIYYIPLDVETYAAVTPTNIQRKYVRAGLIDHAVLQKLIQSANLASSGNDENSPQKLDRENIRVRAEYDGDQVLLIDKFGFTQVGSTSFILDNPRINWLKSQIEKSIPKRKREKLVDN